MERRVIKHSQSSYGISLPSKWVKMNNIVKGSILNIEVNGEELLIKPKTTQREKRKVVIDATELGPLLRRFFDALYKRGFDEIEVRFKDYKEVNDVLEAIKLEASGFEIVESSKNKIVLRSISEINEEEFNNLINRLFFLLKEQITLYSLFLDNLDESLLNNILELERSNNKITHICRRKLNRSLMDKDSMLKYTLVEFLEKIADEFKFLSKESRVLVKQRIGLEDLDVLNDLKDVVNKTLELITILVELNQRFSIEPTRKAYELRKRNINRALELTTELIRSITRNTTKKTKRNLLNLKKEKKEKTKKGSRVIKKVTKGNKMRIDLSTDLTAAVLLALHNLININELSLDILSILIAIHSEDIAKEENI